MNEKAALLLDAAATLAGMALKAFAVARDGDRRANELGTKWLLEAEQLFAEAKRVQEGG